MQWAQFEEEEGLYVDLSEPDLKSETLDELEIGSTVVINTNFADALIVTKEKEYSSINIVLAHNAKLWSGSFSLPVFVEELKKVIQNKGYKITEEFEDYNHMGIGFDIKLNTYSFDSIFNQTSKIIKEVYNTTSENLTNYISLKSIGPLPFSLRKDKKDSSCKILTVHYECINRKFWNGEINLEDLLDAQYRVISLLKEVHVIDYDIDFPEGMSLKYEVKLPSSTTRTEAKEWLRKNIEVYVLKTLELKFSMK